MIILELVARLTRATHPVRVVFGQNFLDVEFHEKNGRSFQGSAPFLVNDGRLGMSQSTCTRVK
jgi:hypothetical protein